MRLGIMFLLSIGLVGCASPSKTASLSKSVIDPYSYEASTASALMFDPPVTSGEPPVELPRDERAMSAFVSFDGPVTSTFWIHTDDRQESEWGGNGGNGNDGIHDRYERRAIIDKTGVTYR